MSAIDFLTREPDNYAYLSGYLLAQLSAIEMELDYADRIKRKPDIATIRDILNNVKYVDSVRKVALDKKYGVTNYD